MRNFPNISKGIANKGKRLRGIVKRKQLPYIFKVMIDGLSFRTTEESLRNAFQNFGQLVEVNLVMDRIANRPRGFAFLRYATEEESKKAIEGMHGKLSFENDCCGNVDKAT
ncbi:hypothetical protein Sjap_014685 [Stephania japonica]|uniref:RRM domain-containing protein n=1 Tax=Stephania japonica TaxID=461633 RepID=A0AAP0IHV8_9MAGN